jgi:hypothetical protein
MVSRSCYLRIYAVAVSIETSAALGDVGHTLARKFELVQSNTVTRSRIIPRVLRATFAKPTLPLKPRGFRVDREDDIECLS